MEILLYALLFLQAVLIILVIFLLVKIKRIEKDSIQDISIQDIKRQVSFLDEKIDDIAKKTADKIDSHYTDIYTKLKEVEELAESSEEDIDIDDLYDEAKEFVVEVKRASASLLQRHFKIEYSKATKLIDMLEENGLVKPADGAKPRRYIGQDGEE